MPSLTINFTSPVSARIKAAIKKAEQLDRPATLDDLKDLVIRKVTTYVRTIERSVGREAVDAGLSDINIT